MLTRSGMARALQPSYLLALLVVCASVLRAQEPALIQAEPQPDSVPPPSVVVTEGNISTQAQADVVALQTLANTANVTEALQRLDSVVSVRESVMDSLEQQTALQLQDRRALGRLETRRSQWTRIGGGWGNTRSRLDGFARTMQVGLDSVAVIRTRWRTTRDSLPLGELPEALRSRIAEVLTEVDRTEAVLRERLNAILTLKDRVTRLQGQAAQVLEDIDAALGAARVRVVARDSRPIWSLLGDHPPDTPLFEQGRNLIEDVWGGVDETISENVDALIWHVLLTIAFLVWFVFESRRSRDWSDQDQGMTFARLVLGRPIASGILLSLILVRATYPTAPIRFLRFLALVAVVPMYRVLPRLVPPTLRPSLYSFAGVLLFAIFVELLEPYSLYWRLALLVSNSLGLVALWSALRAGPKIADQPSAWRRSFRRLGFVIAGALAIALPANVFGFTALAHLLVRGAYLAIMYVLLLLSAALILEGAWVALLRTPLALRSNAVKNNVRLLQRRGTRVLRLTAAAVGAAAMLRVFGLYDPVMGWVVGALKRTWSFGELALSLGGILTFALTIWAAFMISRFIRFLLEEDVMTRVELPRGVPRAILIMLHYALVGVAFLLAISAAGVDLAKVTILAGAFGLAIGFGMQNIINNFVSGLILLFERPIQIGDTVEVGSLLGQVNRIGIRSSTVRTYSGSEVIVPNANLVSSEVINWTLSDRRKRMTVPVGVAYGTDPERVLQILKDVATAHDKVADEPAPWALFMGFGDSSLNFEVRFWVTQYDDGLQTASDVTVAVNRALAEAGIEIPFPQRDLHLRSVDPGVSGALGGPGAAGSGDARTASPPASE